MADGHAAWEAAQTLKHLSEIIHFEVPGLWRLTDNLQAISYCDLVIAVSWPAAPLISVLGGLASRPVIAVPTSVGYGMAKRRGRLILHASLR